ncbi:MAG TPA: Holliday junction resolvase RuvX [Candidatus Tidjanibacter gallistercoris]|nr:Holliday junction resolvase RuvX [Candidatus Tidjanibacter gallistercoris]
MGRILAIDYGTKRTGIAVSDPQRIIAGGLDTVPTAQLVPWLVNYIAAERVDIIVVGLPVRTDGSPSDTHEAAGKLASRLAAAFPDVRVTMFDERFTSVLAHRAMLEGGMKKMQRRDKAAVDRISATILLQDFMDSRAYEEMKEYK